MKNLLFLISKNKKEFILLVMGTFLNLSISLGILWANKILIDEVLVERRIDLLLPVAISYMAMASLSMGLHICLPRMNANINEKIIYYLRTNLTWHIQHNTKKLFQSEEKGDLLNVYNNDIPKIASLINRSINDFIENGVSLLVTITVLAIIDFRIALLAISCIPFYLLLPILFKKKIKKSSYDVEQKNSEINGIIQEGLNGTQQIKIFHKQDWFVEKSANIFKSMIPLRKKQVLYQTLSNATVLIYWMSLLIVFWIGGQQVISGALSIGTFLILTNYIDRIEWPVRRLAQVITEYNTGKVSINRFEKYASIRNTVKQEAEKEHFSLDCIENIQFADVFFQYEKTATVLNNVNIKMEKGQSIGIVGPSGTGKSTLINLLFGFYSPSKGEMFINDKEMNRFRIEDIRKRMALMSQENYVFEASIYENVALGGAECVSKEDIIKAAKMSGAHDFIKDLSDGYDSIYGKGGLEFSTGQKQKIALSRIFLKDPDVIILDEPTASLDSISTKKAIDKILQHSKNKILIVISHDVQSLKDFDFILNLENGELKESI